MKTTLDISDALLREAREVAHREGITFRTLVERGLRRILADTGKAAPFKLRRATFNGNGLQPELRGGSWDRIRDLVYRDHGA